MNELKRVHLRQGDWRAELLPGYAANLISLRCGEDSIIRSPENDETFRNAHIVYGTAFLLPPDRTLGGCFSFEGREYRLPINDSKGLSNIHGLMSDAPFELVEQDETHARLRYENKAERYPFPFAVTVACTLQDGCSMEYEFQNTGASAMPLLFGLHANFADPGYIRVPVSGEIPMNRETFVPGDKVEALSDIGEQVKRGMRPTGTMISGFFTSSGHLAEVGKYEYAVSDTFSHWVLWNGSGNEGFISIEPESGPVNGLRRPGGYQILQAGERILFRTEIRRKQQNG